MNFWENIGNWFTSLGKEFKLNFIDDNRWMYLVRGLGNTLLITFFALLLGLALGFIVAIVRSTYDKVCTKKGGHFFLRLGNVLSKIYLTIIRGTPTTVQLLIIYFVIFGSVNIDKVLCAVLAFGINSGAYVAEIIRSGIMSIDNGQTEAGRSLGLNFRRTMTFIIMPQALKNVLPALGNEFIVLLKETSISGYIGRRHNPQPDVFPVYAAYSGSAYLSRYCYGAFKAADASGEEAGKK